VVEVPILDWMPGTLADRSAWPGDERLSPLMTRRSTLDWVLQRAVLAEPGVTVRDGARVTGLLSRPGRSGQPGRPGEPPRVIGVRTGQGELPSDLVIDAAGRRTPSGRWLQDIGAAPAATWSADCGVAYYSRHYRIRPGRQLPGPATTRIVAGLEEFTLAVFGADNGAMQLAIVPLAADRRFRQVKEPDVFTAVLRTIPACAAWLEVLEPISPVFPMTGPRNTLRRLVVDGRPVVTGLHAIGDSVCTTNPTFGRGLSLAMWGAADLADVVGKHDDWTEQAIAMDERTAGHVAPYYEEQAAVDSARLATLRHAILGAPAPPPPLDPDRISFTQLRAAASFDPAAFRAFWKLMSMLRSRHTRLPSDPFHVALVMSWLGVSRPLGIVVLSGGRDMFLRCLYRWAVRRSAAVTVMSIAWPIMMRGARMPRVRRSRWVCAVTVADRSCGDR
jgi:2-polyprenyl-6-methoxyphenol hydroxylase-like FAD-dependent oxidoreductase